VLYQTQKTITDKKADIEYPAVYKDFLLKYELSMATAYPVTMHRK